MTKEQAAEQWYPHHPLDDGITRHIIETLQKGFITGWEAHEAQSALLEKKYPIGGYAPGNYSCKCATCGEQFRGDKRAVQCEPCAVKMTAKAEAPQAVGPVWVKASENILPAPEIEVPIRYNEGKEMVIGSRNLVSTLIKRGYSGIEFLSESNTQQVFTREQVLLAYYDGFNQSHYSHMHPDRFPKKECESAGKEYMNTNYPKI